MYDRRTTRDSVRWKWRPRRLERTNKTTTGPDKRRYVCYSSWPWRRGTWKTSIFSLLKSVAADPVSLAVHKKCRRSNMDWMSRSSTLQVQTWGWNVCIHTETAPPFQNEVNSSWCAIYISAVSHRKKIITKTTIEHNESQAESLQWATKRFRMLFYMLSLLWRWIVFSADFSSLIAYH